MEKHYLAFDLGAESGRLMAGTVHDDRLQIHEVHRFPNEPLRSDHGLHWNFQQLFEEVKTGLGKAARLGLPFSSVSCDSWGVDYVLFDERGAVMLPVYHYRDSRATRGVQLAYEQVSWPAIFAETGIQFMPINTLFQLAAEPRERLQSAHRLLPIADAIHFLLCGVGCAEETLASTTQLYNPVQRAWSKPLLDQLQFPATLFPPVVSPGTKLGRLSSESSAGMKDVEVLASCSHDTAAAVAGVPASGTHWAYISSGTWSLLGVELPRPVMTSRCRELNFTNELGYGGTVRLLKNIAGLWLVQECRREWARSGRQFEYADLTEMAARETPFVSLIDPADPRFLEPGSMPEKIAAYCRETGQPAPETPGATVRCALESLALAYQYTLGQLQELIGSRIERLHIVGGGSRNHLLNQFTANACQIPVFAGPVEATAAGNIVVQALALGHLSSLKQARRIILDSFGIQRFEPAAAAEWHAAKARFLEFKKPA